MSTMDPEHKNIISQLAEAIQDLSKQVQKLQQIDNEESERLRKYKAEGTLLNFTLVTGGLIIGKLLWMTSQNFGVKTDSDQDIILYKNAIAFIQEQ